ncbi:hypothetical protein [Roseivivax sp. CAU 1753]
MMVRNLNLVAGLALALIAAPALADQQRASDPAPRLSPMTQLSQNTCPAGMNVCSPGSYGPGGCYKPGFGTCTAGLVCTGGTVACKPSNGGPAYCYAPNTNNCK